MDYRERFAEENESLKERMELSKERLALFRTEQTVKEPYRSYFIRTADFILKLYDLYEEIQMDRLKDASLERLQSLNNALYEDVTAAHYGRSYANPAVAVEMLGKEFGKPLCFLYAQIRSIIGDVYEQHAMPLVIHSELLIEAYNCFEQKTVKLETVKQILYWFISDYSDEMLEWRIAEQLDTKLSFARDIIMEADLADLRYLYKFGEYVTENEIKIAQHLNALTQEEIEKLAFVYTEGYRLGFINSNKDLSKKEIVNIRYHIGFERIIRQAVINFEKMGLRVSIYRASISSVHSHVGYEGAPVNRQFLYDHRNDRALYLDRDYIERRLGALRTAYEKYKKEASVFAGPAVMEVFGEEPFSPEAKAESYQLSEKQQKLAVELANSASFIVNQYIPGEERSFTIIAFPLPEIGEPFAEIFHKIVEINTLDYKKYERIQQSIIDALDQGVYVHVEGMHGNRTNLDVHLHPLENSERETIFENCVADVNIPVGEVFTSPKLKGTTGRLHVTKVFLNELEYRDLELYFQDGFVHSYHCANFETEQENKRYVKENVLFHHETLPMGEFAIGTNTTAYVATQRYQLAAKMPILIAEKMGPHFAVGDTCYSWQEDTKVYNPDGKEVIAKDNDCSILRKEDVGKAYFNCHTDITIPYDELGALFVVTNENKKIEIIKNGRFVLSGTESLNEAFDE